MIKCSFLLNCLNSLILFQKSNQLHVHILPLLSSKSLYMLSIYTIILLLLTWKDGNIMVFFLIIHKCLMICFRTLPSPFSTFALSLLVKYCSSYVSPSSFSLFILKVHPENPASNYPMAVIFHLVKQKPCKQIIANFILHN